MRPFTFVLGAVLGAAVTLAVATPRPEGRGALPPVDMARLDDLEARMVRVKRKVVGWAGVRRFLTAREEGQRRQRERCQKLGKVCGKRKNPARPPSVSHVTG